MSEFNNREIKVYNKQKYNRNKILNKSIDENINILNNNVNNIITNSINNNVNNNIVNSNLINNKLNGVDSNNTNNSYNTNNIKNINFCNNFFKECVKKCQIEIIDKSNKFLKMKHHKDTLKFGYKLSNNIKEILYCNRIFTELLKNISDTCDSYIDEIETDIYSKKSNDDFIYKTTNGMLSYDERSVYLPIEDEDDDFIIDYNKYKNLITQEKKDISVNLNYSNNHINNNTNNSVHNNINNNETYENKDNNTNNSKSIKKIQQHEIKIHNRSKILIKEIGYEINIERISDITDIKPMFYWYDGDDKYEAGIYCSPYFNTYTRVPFPKIIDINKDINKSTIICKYITRDECNKQKNKYDKYDKYDNNKHDKHDNNKYDKYDIKCHYVHKGEYMNKIGISARCPKIPDFGNPASLHDDLSDMNLQDMKSILLYGLNDTILMSIWLDYNLKYKKISKHNILVLDEIDKFI